MNDRKYSFAYNEITYNMVVYLSESNLDYYSQNLDIPESVLQRILRNLSDGLECYTKIDVLLERVDSEGEDVLRVLFKQHASRGILPR